MFPWHIPGELDWDDHTDSQYIFCRLSGGILSKLLFLRLNKPILLQISLVSNPSLFKLFHIHMHSLYILSSSRDFQSFVFIPRPINVKWVEWVVQSYRGKYIIFVFSVLYRVECVSSIEPNVCTVLDSPYVNCWCVLSFL